MPLLPPPQRPLVLLPAPELGLPSARVPPHIRPAPLGHKDVTRPPILRIASLPGYRHPALLWEVLRQFSVETSATYLPHDTDGDGDDDTTCNILIWHATLALGREVPHWLPDPAAPRGWRELGGNGTALWLGAEGRGEGWREVDVAGARAAAGRGCPVVAAQHKPAGRGHVAMVVPSPADGELHIVQSGARCLFNVPITWGFGAPAKEFAGKLRDVKLYAND